MAESRDRVVTRFKEDVNVLSFVVFVSGVIQDVDDVWGEGIGS